MAQKKNRRKKADQKINKPGKQITILVVALIVILVAGIGVRFLMSGNADTSMPFPGSPADNGGRPSVGHLANVPGHTPATNLTKHSSLSSSSDGQIINRVEVSGALTILHKNVKVVDSKMQRLVINDVRYSASCEWCTIGDPMGMRKPSHTVAGPYHPVGLYNYKLYRSDIFGAVDTLKLRAGYAEVRESWLHDMIEWAYDPGQAKAHPDNPSSHTDMFQTVLNGNINSIKLINNYWDGWSFRDDEKLKPGCTQFIVCQVHRNLSASGEATGIFSLFQHESTYTIQNIEIVGNIVNGDAYSIFHHTKNRNNGGAPSSFRVHGNIIYQNYPTYGKNNLAATKFASSVEWGCNVNEKGASISMSGTKSMAGCKKLNLSEWDSGSPSDTVRPTVTLTAPPSTVSGSVNLTAAAQDNTGVTLVEFFAGAQKIGEDTSSPYNLSWDTTAVANGQYSVTAKAYDAAGNSAVSAGANVTVNNPSLCGSSTTLICEDFSTNTISRFATAGGTWSVSGGQLRLTNTIDEGAGTLGNRAVHQTTINGDFKLQAKAMTSVTSAGDYAVIFGYQDASNYYYTTFNTINDAVTNGISRIQNGQRSEVVDFTQTTPAGAMVNLEVIGEGSTVTVKRNGTELGRLTNYAAASGRVGFGSKNDPSSLDILTVEPLTSQPGKTGDVDGDGSVNIFDLNAVLSQWSRTDKPSGDIDNNGKVDIFDLNLVLSNWGA